MIQPMPPFFDANATHGKGDDHVSLFDESVVQVAAVHACVRRSGNRSGRRIQTFDFGDHVAVSCCGHVDLLSVGVFED